MRPEEFRVDPDIRRAATPPAEMYADRAWFDALTERVLARGWHVVADASEVAGRETVHPATLLPGVLDEEILMTRDREGALHGISNVCTHRGMILVNETCVTRSVRCGYHGRCFGLDGSFLSMPGMEGAEDFPSRSDSLPRVAADVWGPIVLASIVPSHSFEDLLRPVRDRLGWIDFAAFVRDDASSRDYEIDAPWMVYVDNYLEGFHVPFVHAGLAKSLDVAQYETELLPHGVLQVGVAENGPFLEAPAGHADHGRRIAAYYAWLFPTTMLNVYPWGLSLNVVQPLGPSRTRVRFVSYVGRKDLREHGAGGDLHRVEMEDESVVQAVARGMRSRLYRPGRYSPQHERGVHHFHRLLADSLTR